jgi:hypothetical protein
MKAMIAALAIMGAAGLTGCNTELSESDKTMIDAAAKHDARVLKGEIPGPLIGPQVVDAIAPRPAFEPSIQATPAIPRTCYGYSDPGAGYAGATCY